MQLHDLIVQYQANGFVFADTGNGCGFGELGQFVDWDDKTATAYGNIELVLLDAPITSEDGIVCTYASEWIEAGKGGNYQYRILF